MDTLTIIEWVLIIGVVAFYFGMPAVAKSIANAEKRLKVVNVLNIIYLLISIALIVEIVSQFFIYDMASDYKLSRVGLIFITIVMYCYTTFFKKKQWFE